jgi:hypothetical protein
VSDRRVTDEQILGGFANLHQVVATGFDAMRAEMHAMRLELRNEFHNQLASQIGGLEHRMMRRFDRIEDRLDDHERRIGALEARN